MQLNPYLFFNGNCEAAFKFYEQCLGGKIVTMMTYEDAPIEEQGTPEWRHKILHACLIVGDRELMGSDSPPEYYEETKGFSVHLAIDNPAAAERIFHALAENGKVKMPFEQTFWAYRFGMLVDRFGIPWAIDCEKAA
ncbi:MAG: VOC family protein [Oscillatoriales cyanobacterium RU_3_3]|nr:VOC family protein [Microcoleus sp. SU_5_6]NJL66627.1 VOC family protein [Microcoleus sp. SM1_3_4]NJM60270.1 VOC family protein [Oscillatoriales cyanobacterium RU_3_3]NJR25181.1 VOC family protein [Richelia sp. CSU_2_1]